MTLSLIIRENARVNEKTNAVSLRGNAFRPGAPKEDSNTAAKESNVSAAVRNLLGIDSQKCPRSLAMTIVKVAKVNRISKVNVLKVSLSENMLKNLDPK